MPETDGDVTRLLRQLRGGGPEVSAQIVDLIYGELRRIAGAQMRRERPSHTLQPTAVVHEAYMRLVGDQEIEWQNRAHFFALAARTMRRVLLDYARQRRAERRGGEGAKKVDIDAELLVGDNRLEDVVAVDEVLTRLAALDPAQAQIVELRFFGGLNVDETAGVMGISPSTVKREWRLAKAWLDRELASAAKPE